MYLGDLKVNEILFQRMSTYRSLIKNKAQWTLTLAAIARLRKCENTEFVCELKRDFVKAP